MASFIAAPIILILFAGPALAQSLPESAPPVSEPAVVAAQPPSAYNPPPGYPVPAAPAPPRPPEPPPGHHQHDGFYMHGGLGFGYLHVRDGRLGATETIAGLGFEVEGALGFAVVRNLVVFGNLALARTADPTRTYRGKSETLTNTQMFLGSAGAGLLYYFEPLNMHISGAVGLSILTLDATSGDYYGSDTLTEGGFGTSFMVGKEWWVSSSTGFGVAARVRFASMKMTNYDAKMSATGVSLLFSATYN